MIIEYHRPQNLDEALALITRNKPLTVPLGGGTVLNREIGVDYAVVDLESLGLNEINIGSKSLRSGAAATLQQLQDALSTPGERPSGVWETFDRVIGLEGTYNLRQVGTVAGTLVSANGRSPFATAMLAMDAALELLPGSETVRLGDLLPFRKDRLRGHLITQVTVPLNIRLSYHYIARSPADFPIVSVALAAWPSGRTRVVLGGYGDMPLVAFDGTESEGADIAAESAFSEAADDWASAQYRTQMAGVLTRRCLEEIAGDH